MKSIESNRLQELDALRGIAVFLVVCLHLTIENNQAKNIFKFGVTGVDLFFIISGFVILLTLEKTKTWQDFIVSRFSRLYPVYWISVTLTATLIFITNILTTQRNNELMAKYLANMTMFQSYLKAPHLDDVYWTLQVEMLFYLFMLAIFLSKNLPRVEVISCFALIAVIGYHLLLNTSLQSLHGKLGYYLPILNHFPLFFAGILFYKVKFDKLTFIRYSLIILCFVLQYVLFFDGGTANYRITQTEYGLALIIYATCFTLYVNNYLSFIVNRLTLFLGSISYSLYLLHNFIGKEFIIPELIRYTNCNFWVASFGVALPTTLVISVMINKYIEKPAMNYIRTKYKKKEGVFSSSFY
jgi:peptidoglycan/LPS O-acetylase OafA/YrhL